MEILKIKRVVPYLIERGHAKLCFPDLELKNEENVANDQDDVCPPTKARDRIFVINLGD